VQREIFLCVYRKESAFMAEVDWLRADLRGGLTFLSGAVEELEFAITAPKGHLPFVFGGEHVWIFDRLNRT
jgi:hypothetical protein